MHKKLLILFLLVSFLGIAQKKEYKGYGIASGIASASTPTLKAHHVVLGKYYVDRQKLGNGVLDIRYAKNKHFFSLAYILVLFS